MILIGLVGKKHAGKDTFADMMPAILGVTMDKCLKWGFADALKSECCIAINSVNARLGTPQKALMTPALINANKEKFRPFLQWWGTDYRRDFCDKEYWIKLMSRRIAALNGDTHSISYPDVRFLNEAEFVKRIGGYLVKIDRTSILKPDTHVSETELEKITCDYHIVNNSTLEDFYKNVEAIVKDILRRTNIP